MTPSKPKRNRFAAVIAPCVLGLLLVPLGQHPAVASPSWDRDGDPERVPKPSRDGRGAAKPLFAHAHEQQPRTGAVNLRLTAGTATRVLAELSGAAQESDNEKPKSMEAQAAPPPVAGDAAAVKKDAPPPDKFAFVKDWPFWVIVGGVVVALAGGYMLLRNSNQEPPCAPQFSAGCFP